MLVNLTYNSATSCLQASDGNRSLYAKEVHVHQSGKLVCTMSDPRALHGAQLNVTGQTSLQDAPTGADSSIPCAVRLVKNHPVLFVDLSRCHLTDRPSVTAGTAPAPVPA